MKKRLLTLALAVSAICFSVNAQSGADVAGTYTGDLDVNFTIDFPTTQASITILDEGDGYIGFELKNFMLPSPEPNGDPMPVGTIILSDIELYKKDGVTLFDKTQEIEILSGDDTELDWMGPNLGKLSVSLKGKVEGNMITIDPITIPLEGLGTVAVKFAGTKNGGSGIKNNTLSAIYYDVNSSSVIVSAGQNYQIYNIAGQLVKSGRASGNAVSVSELHNGLYLIKMGKTTVKFVKK